MRQDKIFYKTHYEAAYDYLDSLRPGAFSPEMLRTGDDPTYEQFYASNYAPNKDFMERQNDANIANYMNIMFHIYHMKKNHDKIYYVTPELSAKLAQTSINVDSYFLKSPLLKVPPHKRLFRTENDR